MFGYRHEPLQCHRSVLSRVRPHKLQCSEHHSTRLKRKQCYTQGVSQTNISCFRNLLPVERGVGSSCVSIGNNLPDSRIWFCSIQ